ncbi:MAG: PAS domain S-box protein [Deltaproteobacteria bacterium]|nr:PAS domain S-box protein [Deltaproteobacteria bacterium]
MKAFSSAGLRVRLFFLFLFSLLPFLLLFFYHHYDERNRAVDNAKLNARFLADQISHRQEQIIESTRQLLIGLARVPALRRGTPEEGSAFLAGLIKDYAFYSNMGTVGLDGRIMASALPAARTVNFSDREWFPRVLATGKFTVSDYLVGRITGKPSIVLSYPLRDESGNLEGILFASLDLNWLNQLLAASPLPPDSRVILTTRQGTILSSYPDAPQQIGRNNSADPLMKRILSHKGKGIIEGRGFDGVQRLHVFNPLSSTPEIGGYVIAGVPLANIFAEADQQLIFNFVTMGVVILLCFLLVGRFGKAFILQPVEMLVQSTKKMARGDLAARTGPPYPGGEIGELAGAFDQMAESLQDGAARQKKTEDALTRSESHFRSLIENASDLIIAIDAEGKINYSSPSVERTLGYHPRELLGLKFLDLVHPDDGETAVRGLTRSLKKPDLFQYVEFRGRDKAGSWHVLEAIGKDIVGTDNDRVTVINVRDITDRIRAEQALVESEQKYRRLVENIQEGIWMIDREDLTTFVNQPMTAMLGYGPQEMNGKSLLDFMDDEWKETAVRNLARRQQGLKELHDFEFIRKDGTRVDTVVSAAPIFDRDGNYAGAIAGIMDFTERKKIQKEMEEKEAILRSFFDSPGARRGIIELRENDIRHLSDNQVTAEFFGISKEQMKNRLASELGMAQETLSLWREHLEKSRVGGGKPVVFEYQDAWGDWQGWLLATVCHVRTERGGGEVFTYAVVDITETKKLEMQFLQAQKMEAVGRLAGGVAHDFNNLMTVVLGFSDLVLQELPDCSPLRPEVEEIKNAGHRAAALTRQLLAFSRRQVLQPEVLNLNAIIENMKKMLQRLLGEDVILNTYLDLQLESVYIDPGQLEQVIMNLAVNARDAMPNGGQLTIETTNIYLGKDFVRDHGIKLDPGSYILLSVNDTGTGIPREVLSNIFEPFFTTKEKGKGTGLGLPTVYGIIKQSGGYIWVYSEPGQGTVFKIYFPVAASEARPFPRKKALVENLQGSETILLVEDDDSVRELAGRALRQLGYTILEAKNGPTALELAESYPATIQLLLSDVIMPGMNGQELSRLLTQNRPGLLVLFMSGYTDNVIVHQGILDEGIHFITKPFNKQELAKKVRDILQGDRFISNGKLVQCSPANLRK